MKNKGLTISLTVVSVAMAASLAYFVTAPTHQTSLNGLGSRKASAHFNTSMNTMISEVTGVESKYSLPYDMTAAPKADEANYSEIIEDGITKYKYEDETISVTAWTERMTKKINGKKCTAEYAFADVQISDPSQFRRGWTDNNPIKPGKLPPTTIFNNCNGIVGMSSDFYSNRKYGYIYQYGEEVMSKKSTKDKSNDVLVVDYNGDFHIYDSVDFEKKAASEGTKFTNNIMFSFTFGPALVVDGKNTNSSKFKSQKLGEIDHLQARACIGQLGKLHYLLCTVGEVGADMPTLADEMVARGCITAYNLDGGQSGTLLFKNKHINTIAYNSGSKEKYGERAQDNIIYFGTAKQ